MNEEKIEDIVERFKKSSEKPQDDSEGEEKIILEKYLSWSERERYRIQCKKHMDKFPEPYEEFILRRGNKKTNAHMEKIGRIKVNSQGFMDLGIKTKKRIKIRIMNTTEDGVYELEVLDIDD